MGRIFAIGDVHGCLDKLVDLMDRLDYDASRDTLLFIGDYIDRGPDSRGVVQFILDLRESGTAVVCLRGNHEQMFLDYYHGREDKSFFLSNGGISTLRSYNVDDDLTGGRIPESHLRFFTTLLPYYETDGHIFVHAGLRPGIPLAQQDEDDLIWIRYEFISSSYDFGKTVVFGHTPMQKPYFNKAKIGIDTGAVYGGKLTCLELPEGRIHQA